VSRVGKKPIAVPSGVKIALAGGKVSVEGPAGKLQFVVPPEITVTIEKDRVVVTRGSELKTTKQKHGMVRAVIGNMVTGVSKGFERGLEVTGTGYKVELQGTNLVFSIGFSHPVTFPLPPGVKAKVEKNKITISGADRRELGQTAAKIRGIKHADPYKLKGIKYSEEKIKQKVGKTGAA
jgi:large subunit ribosomal protein L6